MSHPRLDNLVRIGRLKAEPAAESELQGLVRSGTHRLGRCSTRELESREPFRPRLQRRACAGAGSLAFAALRIRVTLPGLPVPGAGAPKAESRRAHQAPSSPLWPHIRTLQASTCPKAPATYQLSTHRPDRAGSIRTLRTHRDTSPVPKIDRLFFLSSGRVPERLPVWHDMHMESTIYQLMVRTYSLELSS